MPEQITTTASLLGDFRNELVELGFDSQQAFEIVRIYAVHHADEYNIVTRSVAKAVTA